VMMRAGPGEAGGGGGIGEEERTETGESEVPLLVDVDGGLGRGEAAEGAEESSVRMWTGIDMGLEGGEWR